MSRFQFVKGNLVLSPFRIGLHNRQIFLSVPIKEAVVLETYEQRCP
jgi:hypothetical protein